MKKKILIVGGARFHGYELLIKLSSIYEVYVLNRGNYRTEYPLSIKHLKADRNSLEDLVNVTKTLQFDIIIDNNAYNKEQVSLLVKVLNKRFEQYIFISSAAIYKRLYTTDALTETAIVGSDDNYSPNIIEYATNKLECEKFIQREIKNYTILRFPNIFGEKDFAHKISYFLYRFNTLNRVLFEKEIDKFSLIYVHDAVNAIISCIFQKQFYNEVFNVSDPRAFSLDDFFLPVEDIYKKKKFFKPATLLWQKGYIPSFGWGPLLNMDKFLQACDSFQFTPFEIWIDKSFQSEMAYLNEHQNVEKVNSYEEEVSNELNC